MASLLDLAQARLGGLLAPPQRPSMVGLLGGQRPQGTLASTIAGYTPPQMQAMSNQQVMDYARTVAQTAQQNMAQQMSDLDKALIMGQQGIQVGDREALARLIEQVPGLMGATAYHGTPHTIRGKFDISKVGTGEGAQAYGHGMYFAENPAVAGEYKRKLSGGLGSPSNELMLNGQPLTQLTDAERRAYEIIARDGRRNALGTAKDLEAQGFDASHIRQALDATKGKEISLVKNEGNLYKVDIPDEYIPNMLDWDKPLNMQTPEVLKSLKIPQEAVDKYNKLSNRLEELQWQRGGLDSPEWEKVSKEAVEIRAKYGLHRSGEEVYREVAQLAKDMGNENFSQVAAENLKRQGITGIRYLDEGSRGKARNQTSNFVVFDPTDVKILEKNSQKVEGLLD